MREWSKLYGIDVLQTQSEKQSPIPAEFTPAAARSARRFHCQIKDYCPTPLVRLSCLAEELGVKDIFVKNEAKRFSLNAFKGLGGSYAMFRILCQRLGLSPDEATLADLQTKEAHKKIKDAVFVTATDGNHGRGVSWAGGIFGCQVHVYMPAGSVEARAEAIRRVGPAQVVITDKNYDETVQFAMEQSEKNGWYLIQDTAWEGYETVPAWIIQGYLTMASEAMDQLEAKGAIPTHVFLQAGVGAMAGGVLGYIASRMGEHKPIVTIVEPETVNCIYRSAKAGKPCSVEGAPVTIMAGLNCGTPCTITWPVLRDFAQFYMSCPDYVAAHGMRSYAKERRTDETVTSGESGAVTMGALSMVLTRPELEQVKSAMNLGQNSVILLISTEGDTDPEGYVNVVRNGSYPAP